MAAANPRIMQDRIFGEVYTFYTDGVGVYFTTWFPGDTAEDHCGRWDPVFAFNQSLADSPIAPVIQTDGLITVTYLDTDGTRLQKASLDDGVSWFTYPPPPPP